jgi:hypothetical protein
MGSRRGHETMIAAEPSLSHRFPAGCRAPVAPIAAVSAGRTGPAEQRARSGPADRFRPPTSACRATRDTDAPILDLWCRAGPGDAILDLWCHPRHADAPILDLWCHPEDGGADLGAELPSWGPLRSKICQSRHCGARIVGAMRLLCRTSNHPASAVTGLGDRDRRRRQPRRNPGRQPRRNRAGQRASRWPDRQAAQASGAMHGARANRQHATCQGKQHADTSASGTRTQAQRPAPAAR